MSLTSRFKNPGINESRERRSYIKQKGRLQKIKVSVIPFLWKKFVCMYCVCVYMCKYTQKILTMVGPEF